MKNSIRNYKKSSRVVKDIAENIEVTKTIPYYTIFGTEQKRDAKLQRLYEEMRRALNLKQLHLETLIIEANKELNRVSQDQITFTLLKSK